MCTLLDLQDPEETSSRLLWNVLKFSSQQQKVIFRRRWFHWWSKPGKCQIHWHVWHANNSASDLQRKPTSTIYKSNRTQYDGDSSTGSQTDATEERPTTVTDRAHLQEYTVRQPRRQQPSRSLPSSPQTLRFIHVILTYFSRNKRIKVLAYSTVWAHGIPVNITARYTQVKWG